MFRVTAFRMSCFYISISLFTNACIDRSGGKETPEKPDFFDAITPMASAE